MLSSVSRKLKIVVLLLNYCNNFIILIYLCQASLDIHDLLFTSSYSIAPCAYFAAVPDLYKKKSNGKIPDSPPGFYRFQNSAFI